MRMVCACIAVLAATTALAAPLPIVTDGEPRCVIAVPPDERATDNDRAAAEELQTYLEKATGVRLPIVSRTEPRSPALLIGHTDEAEALGLVDKSLGEAGFVIRSVDNGIVLAGHRPLGTRYAVYRFLELFADCRWYMPTEAWETVGSFTSLQVGPVNIREVPAFDPRTYGYVWSGVNCSYVGDKDPVYGNDIWATRNLLTVDGQGRPHQHSHNLLNIYRPSEIAETHPEVFPLRNDVRYIPPDDHSHTWQPCFSHPKSVEMAIAAARRYFDQSPNQRMFSLGINDCYGWCECPECNAQNGPETFFRGRKVWSNNYYTYVNDVAREVAKTHPDKLIGCIAYFNVELPPDFALEPSVSVWNTQDTAQHFDPQYERDDFAMLRRWTEVCDHVGKYDYYGFTWVMPRYFPLELGRDLRFAQSVGMMGLYTEDVPNWNLMGPLLWIGARLLWNPQQDPMALQKQYCDDMFGTAAPVMNRFFTRLSDVWRTPRAGRWFGGLGNVPDQLTIYTPAVMTELTRLLEQAYRAAEDETDRERVDFFRRGWRLCRMYTDERDVLETLSTVPRTEQEALTQLDVLNRLPRMVAARHRYTARMYEDPLLGGTYRWMLEDLNRGRSWEMRVKSVESAATGRLISRLALLAGSDEDARQRLAEKIRGSGMEIIFHGLEALADESLTNLVRNPGFEDTAETDTVREDDWSLQGAPPGWGTWQAQEGGEMAWEQGQGRSGGMAVRISGVTDDSCFTQSIAVKPSTVYAFECYARTNNPDLQRTWVRLRWQDNSGWIRQNEDLLIPIPAADGQWQRLIGTFKTPPDVTSMVILLMASRQGKGHWAWFDDVRLIEVPAEILSADGP